MSAAYKGPRFSHRRIYDPYPWEPVPRWHPRYWFGWTFRRCYEPGPYYLPEWQYGRPKRIAREALKEKFDRA